MILARPDRDILGETVAAIREALGWTQEGLAHRVGRSQSWVSRVEHGLIDDLTFKDAREVLAAMGARLVVSVDAPYLGDRRRQRDWVHVRLSAHVVSRLRRAGWEVATEVEVGGDRSRGWIDVLAFHPVTGLLLVIELKTEIRDLGQIQRTLGWYERAAVAAAMRLGWPVRRVFGCLLLLATEANDDRVLENRDVFAAEFPIRARDLATTMETGNVADASPGSDRMGGSPSPRAVAMVDPRSRRRSWIRALRSDGRRSAAPYRDYADYIRKASSRPSGSRSPRHMRPPHA